MHKFLNKYSLVILLLAVYSGYIFNGFTWIDHGDIERGRAIVPLTSIPGVFFERFGITGFYRPFITILHSIDFAFYGLNPAGFHFTSIIFHIITSLVAPLFISAFIPLKKAERLLFSLIFGIHPIALLPVGSLPYRQELLVSLFIYLAIYFYSQFRSRGSKVNLVGFLISFLSALFSKETAFIIVPTLIIFWEFTARTRDNRGKLMLSTVIGVLTAVFYFLLRINAVPEILRTNAADLTLYQAIGTRIAAFYRLLVQLFLPLTPKLSDATQVVPITEAFVLFCVFTTLILTGILIRSRAKGDWSTVIILLFILLIPAMNIFPVPRFYSTHNGYAAIPAFAAIFLLTIRNMGRPALIGVFIWIAISMYSVTASAPRLKNDLNLFTPEVKSDDSFLEGHQFLGDYYFRSNELIRAEKHYIKALDKKPTVLAFVDESAVMNNLAGVYLFQNRLDEADQLLVRLSEKPGNANLQQILYNRAVIADKKGDYNKVIELLDKQDIKWNIPEAIRMLDKAKKQLSGE